MNTNKTFSILSILVLLAACGDSRTADEVISETLSAPKYEWDSSKYASCFHNKSTCTDLEAEQLEDAIKGKYIELRSVKLDDIESTSNPNRFDVDFCSSRGCLSLTQKGSIWMNGGSPPCDYRTSLWLTDSNVGNVGSLKKGTSWNIKGRVTYVSKIGGCNLKLMNVALIK